MSHPLDRVTLDADSYRAVRAQTDALAAPLSAEDMLLQSMREASPTKWHLAHTSWFFETFVLERAVPGYVPFHPEFRVLFNSYYNSVGASWERHRRALSRPSLDEIRRYRQHVDRFLLEWLASPSAPGTLGSTVVLGMHHEQQHQELILTDIKHALSQNPLRPSYASRAGRPASSAQTSRWLDRPGGLLEVGTPAAESGDAASFSFDNESPRHRVFLEPFRIATRAVTNGEFLAFLNDGGYARPELWLADGWAAVGEHGWRAPLYWERVEDEWRQYSLRGLEPLDPDEPVTHVSFFEADAFARWRGCRLPEEREWEVIARETPVRGNFLESGILHPTGASHAGDGPLAQIFGDVWEWTRSPYVPYPGFRPLAGGLGEYNGKFMSGQMVLRGGSCATPRSHIRATYRNYFPPHTRWQFSGIRLAQDAR